MARKRIGVGSGRGNVKKKNKALKKKAIDGCDDEYDILAIKITAATAVRQEYHDIIIPWIAQKNIMSTKICELASLLFLNKVRDRFEAGDWDFFKNGDGEHIIESCFFAVLENYKENEDMYPEFRTEFENVPGDLRMQWPNNRYFGNIFKYLYQQYARNVTTNLTTHAQKRLRQYFKWCAVAYPNENIDSVDIDIAISWTMKRFDSTRGNQERINKREFLLQQVRLIRGPIDDDVAEFTKNEWFSSLFMWLYMQHRIADYNDWLQQQNPDTIKIFPKIKNLCVVPIGDHQRTNIKIDGDVLYRMMCETKLIPKGEDGTQVKMSYISQHKEFYFDQIFNMDAINRMLKANKQFHYHIVSDGLSASILYKVPKRVIQELQNDNLIKQQYFDGYFQYMLGIDPGMKTWLAVVRRHIDSGKEVK